MSNEAHSDWLRGLAGTLYDNRAISFDGAYRLRTIADTLESKDRTIAALTAERDRLGGKLSARDAEDYSRQMSAALDGETK